MRSRTKFAGVLHLTVIHRTSQVQQKLIFCMFRVSYILDCDLYVAKEIE